MVQWRREGGLPEGTRRGAERRRPEWGTPGSNPKPGVWGPPSSLRRGQRSFSSGSPGKGPRCRQVGAKDWGRGWLWVHRTGQGSERMGLSGAPSSPPADPSTRPLAGASARHPRPTHERPALPRGLLTPGLSLQRLPGLGFLLVGFLLVVETKEGCWDWDPGLAEASPPCSSRPRLHGSVTPLSWHLPH